MLYSEQYEIVDFSNVSLVAISSIPILALLSWVVFLDKVRSIWPHRTWQLEQSKSNPVLLWRTPGRHFDIICSMNNCHVHLNRGRKERGGNFIANTETFVVDMGYYTYGVSDGYGRWGAPEPKNTLSYKMASQTKRGWKEKQFVRRKSPWKDICIYESKCNFFAGLACLFIPMILGLLHWPPQNASRPYRDRHYNQCSSTPELAQRRSIDSDSH